MKLFERFKCLSPCSDDIIKAANAIIECYKNGGKVLCCGNGGSSSDSSHLVGELLKGFMSKRCLGNDLKERFIEENAEYGSFLANTLQGSLPAIDLGAMQAIISATANDTDAALIYAQQVMGFGKPNDVFIGISTSGNAKNVICAMITAKVLGMTAIALTGQTGGEIKKIADITITVPADATYEVQELHLPVYHEICKIVEMEMFT